MKKFVVSLVSVFLLAGCSEKVAIDHPLNWQVDNFTFTNQNNELMSLSQLKGKVWLADFIFTTCEDECPVMTSNMVQLRKYLQDNGIENVEMVSFSVDPEVDTPEALQAYAKKFQIDGSDWHFLTGYSQQKIEAFAKDNFHTLVSKPESDGHNHEHSGAEEVVHGTDFYLVNQDGQVVKSYEGLSNLPKKAILEDVRALLN